jgi:hypothetical protein
VSDATNVLSMLGAAPDDAEEEAPRKRKKKRMDEDDVLAVVAQELGNAVGQDGDDLSKARTEALNAYEGRPWAGGEPQAGRSGVVMRSVLEAIEWVLPAVLRMFVSSDKIATIESTRPGPTEEEAAEQATQYVSAIFFKDNDGFSLLHDWLKDGLLQRLGWTKRYWDTRMVQDTQSFSGLTPIEYEAKMQELEQQGEVEVLEEEDRYDPILGPVKDCTIQLTIEESRVRLENVPPEEVLYSPRCRRGYMPFVCHRRARTVSDLIADGYDEDDIEEALGPSEASFGDEARRRQMPEVPSLAPEYPSDDSMREVWVEESYLLLDWNQDGIAELCKVVTAHHASRVLLRRDGEPDIEPVDEIPLVSWTPVPMPHKLAGHSIADLVQDLQQIKSTLMRQILDNIYLTNVPRTVVSDVAANENTYDDIMRARPGQLIRARDATGIVTYTTPFVAGQAFPVVEYIDQTHEVRTGISRHNQGLNPDDLNKTATGVALIQEAASQRCEMIGRIFGRAVQELVSGILQLVRRHQQQARIIMVTGRPLTMDPRLWKSELDVSVSVGLGTGNKDKVLAHLMTILQLQQGIVQIQQGVGGPLVTAQNIYDTLEKLTENAGFRESFFTDPSKPPPQPPGPPQPPPPDPAMMQAQAKMQAEQARAQSQIQINQQKAAAEAQIEAAKAQQQAQLDERQANMEMRLKQMEMNQRMMLEQLDARNAAQLEQQKMEHDMLIERQREASRAALAERETEVRLAQQAAQPAPEGF